MNDKIKAQMEKLAVEHARQEVNKHTCGNYICCSSEWDFDNSYKAGFQAASEMYEADNKRMREALEKIKLSELNQNRLVDVDAETLRMIILHGNFIAAEALAALEQPATEMGEE